MFTKKNKCSSRECLSRVGIEPAIFNVGGMASKSHKWAIRSVIIEEKKSDIQENIGMLVCIAERR